MPLAITPAASVNDPEKRTSGKKRRDAAYGRAMERLNQFLLLVQAWAAKNSDRILRIYLVPEASDLNLYVVEKSTQYDADLRKILSDFLCELTDRGHTVHGSQIPDGTPDELQAYFNPEVALVLTLI